MDQIKLQYFEDYLWKRYTELRAVEERLSGSGGLGDPATVAIGELSAYDQHPADFGTEMYERSKDLGLLEDTRRQIRQIEDALAAIEEGTYGVCRRCGTEIPEERLEAIPETNLCVDCRLVEEGADTNERPIEEASLTPPFGRTFKDEDESAVFDGEDSWQAVARYGTASGMPERE